MNVYLFATLDTKGPEAAFVRDKLQSARTGVIMVDTGAIGQPSVKADISREQIFQAAGTSLSSIVTKNDRGEAVKQAALGAAVIAKQAFAAGELAGIISIGGSAGTTIGTTAMRELPLGVPKLMVSTLASGQVRPYVGDKDILMMNSVVDILGINRISRRVLSLAAAAMAGMVREYRQSLETTDSAEDRPLVAATMFGVTTPCVEQARIILENAGYEVLTFHATGNGGQAMESLIREGLIAGVLDITTTELADELVGGILSAGPDRLTAAGQCGIPQVISVGATDMVNFGPPETVPLTFKSRLFYLHNPTVTLMRTTVEENARLGEQIAAKANSATGPTKILLPLRGVSALDAAGREFFDDQARAALFQSIRTHAKCEVIEFDLHINDPLFAEAAANKLIELLHRSRISFDSRNK